MTAPPASEKKEDKDTRLVWFKEIVTAILAMAIIAAILIFLAPALFASPADATSAQAIFAVLGGWGGVVIGYYFGRIPAEKAAEKAEAVAKSARTERDEAEKTKIQEMAETVKKQTENKQKIDALDEEVDQNLAALEEYLKKKGLI